MTTRSGTGAAVVGALSLFLLAGCGVTLPGTTTGSGAVKTETRTVSGFTAVELAGNGDVKIQQSGTESLSISAEENLLPLLTSEVVDGTLKLGIKDGARIDSTQPITYQVTAKNLTGLDIGGSGNQTATDVKTTSADSLPIEYEISNIAPLAARPSDVGSADTGCVPARDWAPEHTATALVSSGAPPASS